MNYQFKTYAVKSYRKIGVAFGFLPLLAFVTAANAAPEKVSICHIPPGNTFNAHFISVSPNAAPAHVVNHNDQIVPEDDTCTVGVGECAVDSFLACSGDGLFCNAEPGSPPEATELSCSDGADNDCDGLVDDADPDCVVLGCADGAEAEEQFASDMWGCAARVTYPIRTSLCATDWHVCSAQEWVDRRGGAVPAYHYWTNDQLRYFGGDGNCRVSTTVGTFCGSTTPMRVCNPDDPSAPHDDPLGNRCNWTRCGLNTILPVEYFGGCSGNTTAGTLCCQ